MANEADDAQDYVERAYERAMKNKDPYVIPEGKQGNCELCEQWSSRLVLGS